MARTNDPHAATVKAWQTRARSADSGGTVQQRSDWKQGDTEWADGITQAQGSDEMFGRTHDEWNGLDEASQDALDGYMADYESLNGHLRRDQEYAYGTIARMDTAFRRPLRTKSEEMVYRGLSDALSDLRPGDVVEDKGFVSTTLNPEIARTYSRPMDYPEGHPLHVQPIHPKPPGEDLPTSPDYNPMTGHTRAVDAWLASRAVIARIRIPRGAPYLPGDIESAEMVLNRGSRFRVLRAARDSEGRTAYEMELLP